MEQLDTCSDPSKFATMKAEPDWKVLGKRLGKLSGPVANAIKQLSPEQICMLEKSGRIELVGQQVFVEEVKVMSLFNLHMQLTEHCCIS